jgi:hypothetical protein
MKTNNETPSTAIAARDHFPGVSSLQPQSLSEMMTIAQFIAKSAIIPQAFRGKPADIVVTVLTGHELGLDFMQSLRGMHVINGKAILSAQAMVGLCQRHPVCKYFVLVESTDRIATYRTLRAGDPEPTTYSYTIDMARTAQLAGSPTWKKHPAAMLRARAQSALARTAYSDIMMGIYEHGEGEEIVGRELPPLAMVAEVVEVVEVEESEPTPILPSVVEVVSEPKRRRVHKPKIMEYAVEDSTLNVGDVIDLSDDTSPAVLSLFQTLESKIKEARTQKALNALGGQIGEALNAKPCPVTVAERKALQDLYSDQLDAVERGV